MDTIIIEPTALAGEVCVPSSKSMGHREIICAALAEGTSVIDNISLSADIKATCHALRALGTEINPVASSYPGRTAFRVEGGRLKVASAKIDCGESGSTLRFMIPLAALCSKTVEFSGRGKLVSRPLKAYYDIFDRQGIVYETADPEGMTIEDAYKVTNSEGVQYGTLSQEKLSNMTIGIGKALKKNELTPVEKAEYGRKLEAIKILLAAKADGSIS